MGRALKKNPSDSFRKPDATDGEDYALWWGPSREPDEAEAFTEVEATRGNEYAVSQYDSLAGYEANDGEGWRKLTVYVTVGGEAVNSLNALRIAARLGTDKIADEGGDEEIVDEPPSVDGEQFEDEEVDEFDGDDPFSDEDSSDDDSTGDE